MYWTFYFGVDNNRIPWYAYTQTIKAMHDDMRRMTT